MLKIRRPKATITHWRFLLENRHDTANLRTADERHKIWRFCFHFHGITAVVRQDTLSCAHLRQQYDQDWSSGGSVAALVRKPHALSRLHDAQSRFDAFVGSQDVRTFTGARRRFDTITHAHWRTPDISWRPHTIKWNGGVLSRHSYITSLKLCPKKETYVEFIFSSLFFHEIATVAI